MNELEVKIENEKPLSSLYGILVQVRERATDRVLWQRVFAFENQFKALMRIAGYIYRLRKLDSVRPETHYILVKPTLKHKVPEWLLSELSQYIRISKEPASLRELAQAGSKEEVRTHGTNP